MIEFKKYIDVVFGSASLDVLKSNIPIFTLNYSAWFITFNGFGLIYVEMFKGLEGSLKMPKTKLKNRAVMANKKIPRWKKLSEG